MPFAQETQKVHSIINVIDPRVEEGLKKIEGLEAELAEKGSEKSELDKMIHDFNIRHQQECGRLIIQLLTLRKEKLKEKVRASFEWEKAYEEAGKAFHDYQKIFDKTQKESQWNLSEEEKAELKELFRKASKYCHPDRVEDEFQEDANETFLELKSAYNRNDLNRVREIWDSLENEKSLDNFGSLEQDYQKITHKITRLKSKVKLVNEELRDLKNSPAYIQVILLDDWDEYFVEKKRKLKEEIRKMRTES